MGFAATLPDLSEWTSRVFITGIGFAVSIRKAFGKANKMLIFKSLEIFDCNLSSYVSRNT